MLIATNAIAVTPIYRSVGPGDTSAIATGVGNNLTISGSTATFTTALPNNIGIGDVIQYDSDSNGSVDALAFIFGRNSSTVYLVKKADGTIPISVTGDADWSVYRAYTSLYDAEAANENVGISATLRNFDAWSLGKDLVASNEQWNIVCYRGTSVDTKSVDFNGWNTSTQHYLRVFTPVKTTEVGMSQRHAGLWSDNAYTLQTNATAIQTHISNFQVEGLQIYTTGSASYVNGISLPVLCSNVLIQSNIVKDEGLISRSGVQTVSYQNITNVKIFNNIVYGFKGSGMYLYAQEKGVYAYSNTIVNCNIGITCYNSSVIAKNNIVQQCTDSYSGTFYFLSEHNLSEQDDAPGISPVNIASVSFANSANFDYRLSATDTVTKKAGVNLTIDPFCAFDADAAGNLRAGVWDLGALQYNLYNPNASNPAAPINVTTDTNYSSQVNLSWRAPTNSSGIIGYKVYRNNVAIAFVVGTSYKDMSVDTRSNRYTYTVSAINESGKESNSSIAVVSALFTKKNVEEYWSQWHGPSNGNAWLPEAPGPNLTLAWSLDLMDPSNDLSMVGNLGYTQNNAYKEGTLIRADDEWIYLKVNRDYDGAADKTIWKIDPANGNRIWGSGKANGEDNSSARSFQLYYAPQGYKATHSASFYASYFDTLNVEDTNISSNIFRDSHSTIGSRVLMGNWAWKNDQMRANYSISYYHGGRLQFWDGYQYKEKVAEDYALIDHAWDDQKNIIFVLSGFASGVSYQKARYIQLNKNGGIDRDVEVFDIYKPYGSTTWQPHDTDVVMRLALKGDYIYAIERESSLQNNLVRRQISNDFAKQGVVNLGMSYNNRAISYCLNGSGVYVHYDNKVTAYSLGLTSILWEVPIANTTLYHRDVQNFDYATYPGGRNYPKQTIACSNNYVYLTTDTSFLELNSSSGQKLYEYIFPDLPNKRTYNGVTVVGKPGDVALMPGKVLVHSFIDSSKLWAFKGDSSGDTTQQPSAPAGLRTR